MTVSYTHLPAPKAGEIVIKNEVTLTCGTDVKTYKRGYRYEPPFGMGHEASGVVYAVGEGVTGFKVGDRVVAHNSASVSYTHLDVYKRQIVLHDICALFLRMKCCRNVQTAPV